MKNVVYIIVICISFFFIFSHSPAEAAEELVIVGTGSGMPVLKAVGSAFTAKNPGITVSVPESIGSGGGIKAVGNGEYLLGRIARDIQENEKIYGLELVPLANIPIVFFVNNSVPISEITAEQVCKIYSGTIRAWEEVGGEEGKIRVITREAGDSSLLVLQATLSCFKNLTVTPISKTTYTDQENLEVCAKNEDSIAFGSWADIKNIKEFHTLTLDGMHPTDIKYPHIGPLSLVLKSENKTGTVKKFIDFISSEAAKKAIIESGGLPVN